MEIEEALEAMEACEPQANLYMAAEEYAEEQAYDFKGVCDVEDYKELAELMKQAVIYGAHWKEQQMMKDAVHGNVDYPLIGCDFPNIYPNYRELKDYCDRYNIKDAAKVKLIIFKED